MKWPRNRANGSEAEPNPYDLNQQGPDDDDN